MKVKVKVIRGVSEETSIRCRVEGDEIRLIERLLTSEQEMGKMLSKMSSVNELGKFLSYKFRDESDKFLGSFVDAPKEIANEKNIKEIVNFLSKYFAEMLEKAVDIPEIHETIAVVEPPDFIKKKIEESGIPSGLKVEITVEKETGFSAMFVRKDLIIPNDRRWEPVLNALKYNNLFELNFESIVGKDRRNKINLLSGPDQENKVLIPVERYIDKDLNEFIQEIRDVLNKQISEMQKSNSMNLLLDVLYHPLDYQIRSIRIFDEPELSQYTISELTMKRRALFDSVDVEFLFNAPILKEINDVKESKIELDVPGGQLEMKIQLSGEDQYIRVFTREEDQYLRGKRLMSGDLSVVKELENIDQEFVKVVPDLIKREIIKCLVKNKIVLKTESGYKLNSKFREETVTDNSDIEMEVESDVLDDMSDEKREKLITYLVAQKLKRSTGV